MQRFISRRAALVASALAIATCVIACSGAGQVGQMADTKRSQTSTSSASAQPDYSTTASTLRDAYEANEVAADERYKDKSVLVTGDVMRIGKDILDEPYVILQWHNKEIGGAVQCSFSKSDNSKLAELKKGQTVYIKGKCKGLTLGTVTLSDCSFHSS